MQTNARQNIDLEQLKRAIPIMELAEILGLEVKGKQARCYNSQAHSHDDKNKSLGFDVARNRYKCFACGESGSIIDLYKQIKGLETGEAIKELADMTGLAPQSRQERPHAVKTANQLQEPKTEPTKDYSEIYGELVYLCGGLDKESRDYLTGDKRGLTEATLKHFALCSIADYKEIDQQLKAKFSIDDLKGAGLLSDKDSLIFYKHKLIIPFFKEGKIVFLQGRRLDDGQPKYLHIKRPVPLFNPDALTGLTKGSKVYVCEGVFDAMILEQNGYKSVGILGVNNFKPEYTELFKGLEVVLCLDNDEAGERATSELAKMFLLKGQAIKAKQLPDGIKDITEYFTKETTK